MEMTTFYVDFGDQNTSSLGVSMILFGLNFRHRRGIAFWDVSTDIPALW